MSISTVTYLNLSLRSPSVNPPKLVYGLMNQERSVKGSFVACQVHANSPHPSSMFWFYFMRECARECTEGKTMSVHSLCKQILSYSNVVTRCKPLYRLHSEYLNLDVAWVQKRLFHKVCSHYTDVQHFSKLQRTPTPTNMHVHQARVGKYHTFPWVTRYM